MLWGHPNQQVLSSLTTTPRQGWLGSFKHQSSRQSLVCLSFPSEALQTLYIINPDILPSTLDLELFFFFFQED